MNCPSCGPVDPVLTWRPMRDGRRHVRAACPSCGAFLGWAEQTPAAVEEADRNEASRPKQGGLFS